MENRMVFVRNDRAMERLLGEMERQLKPSVVRLFGDFDIAGEVVDDILVSAWVESSVPGIDATTFRRNMAASARTIILKRLKEISEERLVWSDEDIDDECGDWVDGATTEWGAFRPVHDVSDSRDSDGQRVIDEYAVGSLVRSVFGFDGASSEGFDWDSIA